MAGDQDLRLQLFEVSDCVGHFGLLRPNEVEAADDGVDRGIGVSACEGEGVLRSVDDAGVGAAGEDDEAFVWGALGERDSGKGVWWVGWVGEGGGWWMGDTLDVADDETLVEDQFVVLPFAFFFVEADAPLHAGFIGGHSWDLSRN